MVFHVHIESYVMGLRRSPWRVGPVKLTGNVIDLDQKMKGDDSGGQSYTPATRVVNRTGKNTGERCGRLLTTGWLSCQSFTWLRRCRLARVRQNA
jgi:hypothetical protein